MTRTLLLALVLLVHSAMTEMLAQHKTTRRLESFDAPVMWRAIRGDTLYVDCDSVFVYNRGAMALLRINDSLIDAYKSRVALGDSIKALKDSVIAQLHGIDSIQNLSYAMLHARFHDVDSLARESVNNTNDALSLVRKVKLTSFAASGLVGGIVGGLGIKSSGSEVFNWWGALGGTVVGLGINWALQKIID